MVAIPTGIISSSFINIVQKKEQREKFNKEEENRR
jgi:voltage-gated potassium channel